MTLARSCLLLFLLSLTVTLFAAKTYRAPQEPVTILFEGNIYSIPLSYTTDIRDFSYVIVTRTNKFVCHFHQQSIMTTLVPIANSFEVGGRTIVWNCLRYYDTYYSAWGGPM